MTITLESIKEEQTKIAAMIASLEEKAAVRIITLPQQSISLQPGEEYAGVVLGKDGAPDHHLVLLPGEAEAVTWADAKSWAEKAGGELPSRREQALLYANLKEQFQPNWYWSSAQHAADSNYAWYQSFDDGAQYGYRKSAELRARAVRRLTIQ